MNKFGKILENTGSKILAITDGNGKKYHFVGDAEKEAMTAKMIYYLWLSRLFITAAAFSIFVFVAASLSLFKLAPQVSVEPFLIIDQNASENIVRYEPIAHDMASKNLMMETFIRQYILLRNTVVSDDREMMLRWYPGGMINYLSSPLVFDEFSKYRETIWKNITDKATSQEVEIISINKIGGEKSAVWKVDFKTYEVSGKDRNSESGALVLKIRYWTASVTSFFIPGREFMGMRLLNPLGFTVVRYSQSEVEFK